MTHKYCISVSGQRESNRNKSTPIEISESLVPHILIFPVNDAAVLCGIDLVLFYYLSIQIGRSLYRYQL